jgi:hypothetical protein
MSLDLELGKLSILAEGNSVEQELEVRPCLPVDGQDAAHQMLLLSLQYTFMQIPSQF